MRLLALSLVAGAIVLGWFADAISRRRHPARDSGYVWTVATAVIGALSVLDAISAWIEFAPRLWLSGWHLEADRALGTRRAYLVALASPLVAWAVSLLFGVIRKPPHDHATRWLAGSIGDAGVRRWVLCAAALPSLVVVFGLTRIATGATGMSAATWMICALLIVSLVFLAYSAGDAAATPAATAPAASTRIAAPLGPWPEGMQDRGIALERLTEWPASAPPRRVLLPRTTGMLARLESASASGIAPELVEVVTRLVNDLDSLSPRSGLVFAPDDCGQAEVVAHAASELMAGGDETTLIISPAADDELERRLRTLRPGHGKDDIQRLRPGADMPADDAAIWMVDIQTLSDHFLERLTDARIAGRVGLIVWWDVHRYSGVLAANVWAISRRVQRLMAVAGRPGLRTLVLVRESTHAAAQLKPFIQLMLPYGYERDMIQHVEQGFARSVTLHRLRGHAERYRNGRDTLPEKYRHPVLVAMAASTQLGWPTHVPRPPDVARDEYDSAASQSLDAGTLVSARLTGAGAEAGARILHVADADVLALPAIVSQGGRMMPAHLPHHVALTTSDNPFVDFILGQLGTQGLAAFGSRRLVGARGHARIIEHHLLVALREVPDTRAGLRQTFLWNDQVIEQTLEALRKTGNLDREEVLYLDREGTRVIDYRYRSRRPHDPASHPLDTVGLDLVNVRDTTGDRDQGIRMRLDRERATIQAYPHRIFDSGGERYHIHEWTPDDLRAGSLKCKLHEPHERTWRVRNANVQRIVAKPGKTPAVIAGSGDHSLTRTIVDLLYEESVNGVVRAEIDPATGERRMLQRIGLVARRSEPMPTTALVLAFDNALGTQTVDEALPTLALALAYVLPVMLGVDQDALEVVQLRGRHVARSASDGSTTASPGVVHGLAIVDLYPHGIGLVDAFEDDPGFVLHVLDVTRQWLRDEATHNRGALAKSPLASAVRVVEPQVAGAAALLDLLLGAATPPRAASEVVR